MIKEEDFKKAIEATFDNESAAESCFALARRMCIEFGEEIEQRGFFPLDKVEQESVIDDWIKSNQ